MVAEDKELLLKDLCARLPYQPMCEFTDTEYDFCNATARLGYSLRDFVAGKIIIKPYLRPMSSMTEEEKEYIKNRWCDEDWNDIYGFLNHYKIDAGDTYAFTDWLNKHHFDYRGLIPMGLALEATEDLYKTK